MENDNDNEPLTFQSLGLAAALVINRIRCVQALRELQTDSPESGKPDRTDNNDGANEDKDKAHRAYIERRLKELAAFERKLGRLGPDRS